MKKVRLPKGHKGVSWNGTFYAADKDGLCEVPEALAKILRFEVVE